MNDPPYIIPDTNYLMNYPDLHQENWYLKPLEILISETVLSELRALSKSSNAEKAAKAKRALDELEKYRGALGQLTEATQGVKGTFVERFTNITPPLNPHKPDHQLIAHAHSLLTGNPHFCALLSNDRELCAIAEAMSVITVSRFGQNDPNFHAELKRKYEWWKVTQGTKYGRMGEEPIPKRTTRKQVDQDVRLHQFIHNLYGQVRAARYRTTIGLASLNARIEFAAHAIQRVRAPEKQVVMVIVDSHAAAQYWAEEIRVRTGLNHRHVQIFGQDDLVRRKEMRAVIFRRDQIVRRIPGFIAQLRMEKQGFVAIVDGCDEMEPVDAAVLLYECDSFVGFNHYPVGYPNAPGYGILSALLRSQTLLTYSFADAERGAWGRPHTFFPHVVSFTPEERGYWEELNADYVHLREKLIVQNPDLRDTDNFWGTLYKMVDAAVIPEIADLLKIREQREQLSQLASKKQDALATLIESHDQERCKRLIFDYARQWTPVLLKKFNANTTRAVELPGNEDEQIKTWQDFSGRNGEILILSTPPEWKLPRAYFHQLIILTPLRRLSEINTMIDWALSHTDVPGPFKIDLLYTDETPERPAMLDLAASSFGLRYERRPA